MGAGGGSVGAVVKMVKVQVEYGIRGVECETQDVGCQMQQGCGMRNASQRVIWFRVRDSGSSMRDAGHGIQDNYKECGIRDATEGVFSHTYTVVTICPGASGMRFSCAIQMALTPSYSAVPSMLTVAPSGRTKRLMRRSIPFFSSTQRMVVGKVAEL